MRWSLDNNHLDLVKYLVSLGADIRVDDNYAIKCASAKGYLDLVKFLVSVGADIHADNDFPIQWASRNGARLN